jgi:hypothetical protein
MWYKSVEERQQRKQWLDSLKEGDKVYTVSYSYGRPYVRDYIIKRITPTRRFRLSTDALLDTEGCSNGVDILPLEDTRVQQALLAIRFRNALSGARGELDKMDKTYSLQPTEKEINAVRRVLRILRGEESPSRLSECILKLSVISADFSSLTNPDWFGGDRMGCDKISEHVTELNEVIEVLKSEAFDK